MTQRTLDWQFDTYLVFHYPDDSAVLVLRGGQPWIMGTPEDLVDLLLEHLPGAAHYRVRPTDKLWPTTSRVMRLVTAAVQWKAGLARSQAVAS